MNDFEKKAREIMAIMHSSSQVGMLYKPSDIEALIAAALQEAVEAEKERCAAIARKYSGIWSVLRSLEATYKANAGKEIEASIRSRGEK